MNIKQLTLIVLLATIVVIGGLVYLKILPNSLKTQVTSKPIVVEKIYVDFDKSPHKFPLNIPIELGAKVTENYNSTNSDNTLQATRTFKTNQSLSANLAVYTKFLTQDGWDIKGTTDEESYKMVAGIKGKQTLLVSMDNNETDNVKTVSITYSELR